MMCTENVSGGSNVSKTRGVCERVKLCVGGDCRWKFGGEHRVGAEERKHM